MSAFGPWLLLFAIACGTRPAAAPPQQQPPPSPPHAAEAGLRTIPLGMTLVGEAEAPTERVSLAAALALRDALPRRDGAAGLQPGDRTWFFRAFGRDELVFLDCSYAPEPPPERPIKRAARWRVERRISLPRSDESLDAFRVRDEVRQYEEGFCGVRVGTSQAELTGRFGEPTETLYPAAAGCVLHRYGDLDVTVCFEAVTSVSLRGECPR